MSNAKARADHFDNVIRRTERRARNHLATLRELLDQAEQHVASTDSPDRGMLASSATQLARAAAELAEDAAAWTALAEVAYIAHAPAGDVETPMRGVQIGHGGTQVNTFGSGR